MNDKIITALLAVLLALGGWTLSRTFSLSQDMVLIKEKVSQMEEKLDKSFKKKKKKKQKSNGSSGSIFNNWPDVVAGTFSWM